MVEPATSALLSSFQAAAPTKASEATVQIGSSLVQTGRITGSMLKVSEAQRAEAAEKAQVASRLRIKPSSGRNFKNPNKVSSEEPGAKEPRTEEQRTETADHEINLDWQARGAQAHDQESPRAVQLSSNNLDAWTTAITRTKQINKALGNGTRLNLAA